MIDGFLKFASKAEAESIFAGLGIYPVDGGNLSQTTFLETAVDVPLVADGEVGGATQAVTRNIITLDVVFGNGEIWLTTGNKLLNPDGEEYDEMVKADGYHVNVRYFGDALPDVLVPYAINPDPVNPKCRFA